MVLTYIIDHYFPLSDVTVFIHSHNITWHNNDFLEFSSSSIVRRLSSGPFILNDYMNLRYHLESGCPDHIHPTADEDADNATNNP